MDERKKQILNAIIKDYIVNGEPVGSRAVAKKYGLGVSPATIRNEMSDLEELGYIEQPHTSAGRVPSDKGYHYYVDYLMQKEQISQQEAYLIREALSNHLNEMEAYLRSCCSMISHLTNYITMIALPEQGQGKLEKIQLLPLDDYRVMVVLYTSIGAIRHKVITLSYPIAPQQLAQIESMVVDKLTGMDIDRFSYGLLKRIIGEFDRRQRLLDEAFSLLDQALADDFGQRVFTDGALHMLSQPEFRDVDKLRGVFEVLEEEEKVQNLLAKSEEAPLSVAIGGDMPDESLKNCSIVTANYYINGKKAGTIGVMGPTRMSYPKTISLVEFIAKELSNSLTQLNKRR